ncbi:hypothetical protein Tco_0091312 [Tanacetum coccineum]
MAQQAIWFNPRNLSVDHVPPSKSIVLIIAIVGNGIGLILTISIKGYSALDNAVKDEDPNVNCPLRINEEGERVDGLVKVGGLEDLGENLLPTILAQVGNQGNVGSQNGNVVNENVQENVRMYLNSRPDSYDDIEEFFVLVHEIHTFGKQSWNHVWCGLEPLAYTDRFQSLGRGSHGSQRAEFRKA